MRLVHELDRDGLLGTVGGGLQAEVLEPLVGAVAEAVHRAVEVDRGDGLVHVEDALHHGQVLVARGTFVMDDEVVALRPVVLSIDVSADRRFVIGPPDIDADVGALRDTLGEDLVLPGVVVAASARDEEDAEGLHRILGTAGKSEGAAADRGGGHRKEAGNFMGRERSRDRGKSAPCPGDGQTRNRSRNGGPRGRESGLHELPAFAKIPFMTDRRDLLKRSALALGAAAVSGTVLADVAPPRRGRFAGKIRKSLKWNMVKLRDEQPLVETFKKLRECGYEGLEPSLADVPDGKAEEWISASRESGLILDGTVAARTEDLKGGIDLTKAFRGRFDAGGGALRPEATDPAAVGDRARDQLKEIAPYAEQEGVLLLVENVWATFLISPFDMAASSTKSAIPRCRSISTSATWSAGVCRSTGRRSSGSGRKNWT